MMEPVTGAKVAFATLLEKTGLGGLKHRSLPLARDVRGQWHGGTTNPPNR
jgi:hypothetical protein